MSILDALPQPRRVAIQGVEYLVSQLQIKDFAAFQSYLEERHPHPLEVARGELKSLEGPDYRRKLAVIQKEDYDYPPQFPCEESDTLFQTVSGLAYWLMIVLNKHNGVTAKRCLELADSIDRHEWLRLQKIAYNLDPSDELYRLCNPDYESTGSNPPDWASMIDNIAVDHGWTYEEIGNLTLSQFSVAMTGSGRTRRPAPNWSHLSAEEMSAKLREQRLELGLDDKEGV